MERVPQCMLLEYLWFNTNKQISYNKETCPVAKGVKIYVI